MDSKRILQFLKDITANNNREWFTSHKEEFLHCRDDYEAMVAELIGRIAEFDSRVVYLTPKDCIYRFYRDVRFSEDKSPYKRHFGAYICEGGKKSLRAGYYIHMQPGRSFISAGAYWLPTNILTSCRNEIMGNIDEWRKCVEGGQFVKYFGYPAEGVMTEEELSPKGFGLAHLKTCPKDFPRDYEFVQYLRMKDYATWHRLDDDFFEKKDWMEQVLKMFKVAKPMMYFVNDVIADYE